MSTKKTILKNMSALFGAQVVTSLLTPILFIVISRTLGNEIFGKYSFLLALAGVFLLIAEFGIRSVAIRDVARDLSSLNRYFQNIIVLKAIFSIITVALFILVVYLMDMPHDTTLASYIFAGGVFFQSMSNAFRWVFHATQVMEKEAYQRVTERVLILVLSLLALWNGLGLIALALAFLITQVIIFTFSMLISLNNIDLKRIHIDFTFGKSILQTALFFALCEAAYLFFFRIDVIMLGKLQGEVVAGWYNAAFVIVSFISIISLLLVQVMFPILSNLYENDRGELKRVTERIIRYLMVIGLPIVPLIAIFADKIINLLYGAAFTNSATILKILICPLIVILPGAFFAGILSASNKHKQVAMINLFGMIINITVNLWLIPKYGYVGACIAAVTTQTLLCLSLYRNVLKVIDIKIFKSVLYSLPGFVAMILIVNLPVDVPLILLSSIATVVYLFLSFLTGSIRNDDIAYISGFFVEGKQSLY